MSITVVTDVFCDKCGNWAHWSCGNHQEISAAKVAAKKDGWTITRLNGFEHMECPFCNGAEPGYWYALKRDPLKKYHLEFPS